MACKCYHADKNFLGKIGVCWGTKECEACSCGGEEAKCDFYDYVRERVKKLTTNADRIRSMTDEGLAEWVTTRGRTFGEEYEGYASALDWLKAPVEVDK